MLGSGHADTVDNDVGHFVAIIRRVQLPIDPNRRGPIDLDPARHGNLGLIRLACQAQAQGAVSIVIPPWNGVFGKYLKSLKPANEEELDLDS